MQATQVPGRQAKPMEREKWVGDDAPRVPTRVEMERGCTGVVFSAPAVPNADSRGASVLVLPACGAWRALICCACARHVLGFWNHRARERALSVARYGDIEATRPGTWAVAHNSLGQGDMLLLLPVYILLEISVTLGAHAPVQDMLQASHTITCTYTVQRRLTVQE